MQLRKLAKYEKAEIKLIHEFRFALIVDSKQTQDIIPAEIDGILIENPGLIENIRKNDSLYLKPLFIQAESPHETDGIYNSEHSYSIINKVKQIIKNNKPFEDLEFPENQKEKLAVKLLRFSLSRNKAISPQSNRISKISYTYHLVNNFSIERNPINHLNILEELLDKGYFSSQVIDRINLCFECQGNYLNFSETCSKCNSLDLKTENLIHHFRCAYIGPESDFNENGTLQCPKCSKSLKHIGIDYDKPSEIHTCSTCTHTSQETTMKAQCVDCGESNHLNQITSRTISSFHPTEKGREKALETLNLVTTSTISEPVIDSSDIDIPQSVYELLKKHEVQKENFYENTLYELTISISQSLKEKLKGQMILTLLKELSLVISHYLESHDLITIQNNFDLNVLLINYTNSQTNELTDILDYNLNKMLKDNHLAAENPVKILIQNLVE